MKRTLLAFLIAATLAGGGTRAASREASPAKDARSIQQQFLEAYLQIKRADGEAMVAQAATAHRLYSEALVELQIIRTASWEPSIVNYRARHCRERIGLLAGLPDIQPQATLQRVTVLLPGEGESNLPDYRHDEIEDHLFTAGRCVAAGKLANAEKALRAADRSMPDDARVKYNLGSVCLLQGKVADAQQSLEHAIELNADDATTLALLGIVYRELGESAKAQEQFARAKALGINESFIENYQKLLTN